MTEAITEKRAGEIQVDGTQELAASMQDEIATTGKLSAEKLQTLIDSLKITITALEQAISKSQTTIEHTRANQWVDCTDEVMDTMLLYLQTEIEALQRKYTQLTSQLEQLIRYQISILPNSACAC